MYESWGFESGLQLTRPPSRKLKPWLCTYLKAYSAIRILSPDGTVRTLSPFNLEIDQLRRS